MIKITPNRKKQNWHVIHMPNVMLPLFHRLIKKVLLNHCLTSIHIKILLLIQIPIFTPVPEIKWTRVYASNTRFSKLNTLYLVYFTEATSAK